MVRTLNPGILAHVDAGRTSLTERLHAAGVIDEVGCVDDGSTPTDSLALEWRRGITIKAAVVSFDVGGMTVNLIDTPGHPDFVAEGERVLGVLGGAVLVEHDAAVLGACVEGRVASDSRAVVAAQAHRCAVHPVYVGSAIKGAGVPELVAGLAEFLPPASGDPDGVGSAVEFIGECVRDVRQEHVEHGRRLPVADAVGFVLGLCVRRGGRCSPPCTGCSLEAPGDVLSALAPVRRWAFSHPRAGARCRPGVAADGSEPVEPQGIPAARDAADQPTQTRRTN